MPRACASWSAKSPWSESPAAEHSTAGANAVELLVIRRSFIAITGCSTNNGSGWGRAGNSGDGEALGRSVAARARCGSFEAFAANRRDRWSFTCRTSDDMFEIMAAQNDAVLSALLAALRSARLPGRAGPCDVVSQFQTAGTR